MVGEPDDEYRKGETEQRLDNLGRIVKMLAEHLGMPTSEIDRMLIDGLP